MHQYQKNETEKNVDEKCKESSEKKAEEEKSKSNIIDIRRSDVFLLYAGWRGFLVALCAFSGCCLILYYKKIY